MVRRSPFFLCLLAFFCVSIPLASCDRVVKRARDRTGASRSEENEPQARTSTVNLIAAGDIFPSPSLIQGGIRADGTRDYTPYYRFIEPYVKEADLATAWFGGPVAGPGEEFTGYPEYNNPPEFALAPKLAGFDILFHTNHLLDRGVQGMLRTIDFFRDNGLVYLGVYDTEEASKETTIIEKNGIEIAFLSYLYGINGRRAPQKWMVDLIDPAKIEADIRKARERGADFVIVAMHWGVEYARQPNQEQIDLAARIASCGADMILGSHPHVIQPAACIETRTEAGETRKTFVIYSCGNFLCSQRKRYTDCGLLLKYTLEKDHSTGRTTLAKTSYVPTWVKWQYNQAKRECVVFVLPIRQAMLEYERREIDYLTAEDYAKMKTAWEDTVAHLDNAEIGFVHEE